MNTYEKMRKALIKVSSSLCPACRRRNCNGCPRAVAQFMSVVRKALALPPRNCDMGTVEEQRARYIRFCRQHAPCDNGNCPLRVAHDCIFTWAQMTYEEGGEE